MDDLLRLLEKLRHIEALHAGAMTQGERDAAEAARNRVLDRLGEMPVPQTVLDPEVEWRFSIADRWSRRLFLALCKHHGLKPFRKYRQRYSTVMLRATRHTVNEVLWPTYLQFSEVLQTHLDEITTRVIRDVLHQDDANDEADEVMGELGHDD